MTTQRRMLCAPIAAATICLSGGQNGDAQNLPHRSSNQTQPNDTRSATDLDALFPPPPPQSRAVRDAVRPATVDASTRWAFRALPSVTVHSPIVRLGDVIQPLDPDMASWQRLSRSPIGLVPLGGQVMTIDRDRLAHAITSAEATARTIDWVGAHRIAIHYRKQDHPTESAPAPTTSFSPPAKTVTHSSATPTVAVASHTTWVENQSDLVPFDPVLTKRLVYWIELAVKRFYPEIGEAHAIQIDRKQLALRGLQSVTGIDHVEFHSESIAEGQHRLWVTGRSTGGPVQGEIAITLVAHPTAIVTKDSFRRGHRLQRHELTTRPIPEDEWNDRYITSVDELLGMEAKTTIRENVPITRDAIGRPLLIRRGDRVEVRVLGGGISVTTNGKALEEGSESDLIEIETLEPRKRLITRVAAPGIVEIVTRPPRVEQ